MRSETGSPLHQVLQSSSSNEMPSFKCSNLERDTENQQSKTSFPWAGATFLFGIQSCSEIRAGSSADVIKSNFWQS